MSLSALLHIFSAFHYNLLNNILRRVIYHTPQFCDSPLPIWRNFTHKSATQVCAALPQLRAPVARIQRHSVPRTDSAVPAPDTGKSGDRNNKSHNASRWRKQRCFAVSSVCRDYIGRRSKSGTKRQRRVKFIEISAPRIRKGPWEGGWILLPRLSVPNVVLVSAR